MGFWDVVNQWALCFVRIVRNRRETKVSIVEAKIRRYCEAAQSAIPGAAPFTVEFLLKAGVFDESEREFAIEAFDRLCQKGILEYNDMAYFIMGRGPSLR